ncbi:tRNA (adenosine(37)-N6)-threonylcarbamoyltransferase complex ATPase subunit type 1 TsaE [Synechococcus sp. Cruz CV12-2-Slac-r]|uniref:tRNA (adenosine(37)-N6)-threonylcarbamoyltransferase complex ATPase subunit type 1 TsaE n=2 Tax=unclassified Synechococcus TaxID=2626047 RepID=UPI0020CD6A74|nr:tRNA (adenosine(37)-N6)-threonylcarbamoyltransferase complex ATPase subunit type 1 TsaE [Synechococcus sp. Cruz CV12-2-Slac-r]MCP9940051.1 tRNA (adenosine(37)-N6)-threonylcarbamoyltransferase complex ATPase subunit type 1 TsaE [Synechococcus sp. Cruz CV12-2-Slac-r]
MNCFLVDAEATRLQGLQLAQYLPAGALLLLSGPLGAGKTALVQGIAAGLGITEAVTSPSYALAQHYYCRGESAPALIHLDLYRLEQAIAADELFFQEAEEALACNSLMAVEWPERLSALPTGAWLLQLSLEGEGRHFQLQAPG